MTIRVDENGRVVHYPNNPDKFEFDEEVAEIFPDMASRSIPMYDTAKTLSIGVLMPSLIAAIHDSESSGLLILDIGASHGHFYEKLWSMLEYPVSASIPNIKCIALDNSPSMLAHLKGKLPHVHCLDMDALEISKVNISPDIVNISYVLQFIPVFSAARLLSDLYAMMPRGGQIIISQKSSVESDRYKAAMDALYRHYRLKNGYTAEEIDAKNRALSSVMTTHGRSHINGLLYYSGFRGITELCSYLHFNTIIAEKP